MKHSESIKDIALALSLAQAAMGPAVKGRTNPHFRSTYADLASYIEASRDALAAQGLAISQGCEAQGAAVRITTLLLHKSGEWLESTLELPATKEDPQGIGSAISYGRRYALAAMLNMGAEDDDGNRASERAPVQRNPSAAAGSPAPDSPKPFAQRYNEACESIERRMGMVAGDKCIQMIKDKHGGANGTLAQKQAAVEELEALAAGQQEAKP